LFSAADPSLNHAREEVAAIAKLYPGHAKVVDNGLIKESELKAGDYEVVHLAVHGQFDVRELLLSHLKLAPDAASDGRLTAAEMFGLPFENTTLVTLSACETGKAVATDSNEAPGMQRALLYAGAQNLLLSSWKVDSEAKSVWMKRFYLEAQSKPVGGSGGWRS
jgi:CHAT domain-containing protein